MTRTAEEIFRKGWQAPGTMSGAGSTARQTALLRHVLPELLEAYRKEKGEDAVLRVNDVGCGDLAWMRTLALTPGIDYVGYDAVEWPAWAELRQEGWRLYQRDITWEPMREADLVICRDVMIHMPTSLITGQLLPRLKAMAPLLLATTYISGADGGREFSNDARPMKGMTRSWARLDLTLPPFSLADPVMLLPEHHPGKYLGFWRLEDPDEE